MVQDGNLVHNNVGEKEVNIVGFDDRGKLVLGKMTAHQLEARHIREAVMFAPNLIVEGKSVISRDGGGELPHGPVSAKGRMVL